MILLLCLLLQEGDATRIDRDADCMACHADPEDELKTSVHAKTGCIGCHGTDEVRKTQSRGNPHRKLDSFKCWKGRPLSEDCGSCHEGVLAALKRSGHAAPAMKKGCLECHGYHSVRLPARSEIFNECRRCHDPSSMEHERGRRLIQDLDQLDGFISQADLRVRETAGRPGLSSGALADAAARAERALEQLGVAQHGLKFAELKTAYDAASEPLHASYNQLSLDEERFRGRWKWLAPFLGCAAVLAALIAWRRKESP